MTKRFWVPLKKGKWRYNYVACYEGLGGFSRAFENGAAREQFIREQNAIVRKCASDEEYYSLYKNILLLSE